MMRVILETSPTLTPAITPPLLSLSLLGSLKYQIDFPSCKENNNIDKFVIVQRLELLLGSCRYTTQNAKHVSDFLTRKNLSKNLHLIYYSFSFFLHFDEMSGWFPIMFVFHQHFCRLKGRKMLSKQAYLSSTRGVCMTVRKIWSSDPGPGLTPAQHNTMSTGGPGDLPAGLQVYSPSSDPVIRDSLRQLVTEQQDWETEVVTSTNIYKQRENMSPVFQSQEMTDYLSIEGPEDVLRSGDHIVRHALNSGLSSCSRLDTGDLELTDLTSIYEDLSGSQYLHPRDHNLYYSLTKTGGSGSTKYPPPASTTYLAWEQCLLDIRTNQNLNNYSYEGSRQKEPNHSAS